MKKAFVFLGFLLLGFLFFILTLWSVDFNKTISFLTEFPFWAYLLIIFILAFNLLIVAIRWKIIVEKNSNKKVSLFNLFLFKLSGYSISYVTPAALVGGEPFRIYFLREIEKISLSKATTSVVIDKIIDISAFVIMILFGFFWAAKSHINFGFSIVLNVAFIFIVSSFFLFFISIVRGDMLLTRLFRRLKIFKIKFLYRLEEPLEKVEKEMSIFFQNNTKKLIVIIILSLASLSLVLLENFLVIYALGIEMNFGENLIFTAIPCLFYFVPIPGAFGTYELARNSIFYAFGLNVEIALASSIATRFRDFLFIIFGFIYASRHGVKMLHKEFKGQKKL